MTVGYSLSLEERGLLLELWDGEFRGARIRVPKSTLRDKLQRRKLIFSRSPNPGGRRAISGHGNSWHLTPEGRQAIGKTP